MLINKKKTGVVKLVERIDVAYQKTDAGEVFGDALAARGCYFVNKLASKSNRPRYCSLWRIIWCSQTSKGKI